jgi:hypothetical protein
MNEYMQDILLQIINNKTISKLLYYNATPLQCPDLIDPTVLLNTKVYTQTYIPPTDTQACFLSVWFDDFRQGDDNIRFVCNTIRFGVVCHRDLWQIDEGMRVMIIMSEIDKLFNLQKNIGMGKNYFIDMKYNRVNELYNAYTSNYKMWEFSS